MHLNQTRTPRHAHRLLAVAIAFCGAHLSATAQEAAASGQPSFSDCFRLKPGVSYDMRRANIQIVEVQFEGRPAIAVVNQEDGVKIADIFDLTGRQTLAYAEYGIKALGGDPNKPKVEKINLAPQPQFPANARPGDTFEVISGGEATTTSKGTEKDTDRRTARYTFVGYEDLTVSLDYKPHVFRNACHLRTQRGRKGGGDYWYVPDFGKVKLRIKDDDGDLLLTEEITSLRKPRS